VAYDLGHGNTILQRIRDDQTAYHLVEIMACPGGCVGGGGQPEFGTPESIQPMAELMYEMDQEVDIRKPRKNPSANKIYEEVLKMPSGEQSQALLQTTFTERGRY
jgi:iron only hydrogenase large subunit-like protein